RTRRRFHGPARVQQLLLDPELAVRLHADLLRDAAAQRARAASGPGDARRPGSGAGTDGGPCTDGAGPDRGPPGALPPLPGILGPGQGSSPLGLSGLLFRLRSGPRAEGPPAILGS